MAQSACERALNLLENGFHRQLGWTTCLLSIQTSLACASAPKVTTNTYVRMYVRMHVCIYAYTYICMRVYAHVCMYISTYECTNVCMYVYTHILISHHIMIAYFHVPNSALFLRCTLVLPVSLFLFPEMSWVVGWLWGWGDEVGGGWGWGGGGWWWMGLVEGECCWRLGTQRMWGHRHWRHYVFSDESRFILFHSDGRARGHRRQGGETDKCMHPTYGR